RTSNSGRRSGNRMHDLLKTRAVGVSEETVSAGRVTVGGNLALASQFPGSPPRRQGSSRRPGLGGSGGSWARSAWGSPARYARGGGTVKDCIALQPGGGAPDLHAAGLLSAGAGPSDPPWPDRCTR